MPARNTDDGIRAVKGDKAIEPACVQRYFETKLGDDMETFVAAMQVLVRRHDPDVSLYIKDVLDQLLAGSTDYESLLPDRSKQRHPEAIREYRQEERCEKETHK